MSKPTPEQIKKQKLEWIADYKESVETGKPMREWEYKDVMGKRYGLGNSIWFLDQGECRRKPEVYTFYWCVVRGVGSGQVFVIEQSTEEKIKEHVRHHGVQQLTPIKKETVELQP